MSSGAPEFWIVAHYRRSGLYRPQRLLVGPNGTPAVRPCDVNAAWARSYVGRNEVMVSRAEAERQALYHNRALEQQELEHLCRVARRALVTQQAFGPAPECAQVLVLADEARRRAQQRPIEQYRARQSPNLLRLFCDGDYVGALCPTMGNGWPVPGTELARGDGAYRVVQLTLPSLLERQRGATAYAVLERLGR